MKLFSLGSMLLSAFSLSQMSAYAAESAWLYCMDERFPVAKATMQNNPTGMKTTWQWAKGGNGENLQKYSPFVITHSNGVEIVIKDRKKYSNFVELKKRFAFAETSEGNTWFQFERPDNNNTFLFNTIYNSNSYPLKDIKQNYAVVDHVFQSMDDAKAFCNALQNKCGQDYEHLTSIGYGSRNSAWNGIRAETTGEGVNCDSRFPPELYGS